MGGRRWWLAIAVGLAIWAVSGLLANRPSEPLPGPAPAAPPGADGESPPSRSAIPPGDGEDDSPRGPTATPTSDDSAPIEPHLLPPWMRDALELDTQDVAARDVVSNRDGALNPQAVNSADLRVLAEIVSANGLHEASSPFDYDDGNGVFEPWELGLQVWEDGSLVALALGPDRSSTFGYGIAVLPGAVRELQALRYLDLHANGLAELPPELCELTALRHLYLFRNQLASLPESLGDLASLEVLMVGDNRIERVPESIEDLAVLERLQLSGNPLEELPDGLRELRALEVLDIARTGSADAGFENLADVLDSLGSLEEIHLTGPEVGDAPPPERLRDGSIPRVYGYTRGRAR